MARIFVFDDDESVRSVVRRLLSRRGHEVFTFARPTRCDLCPCTGDRLSCAEILISDVSMPELGGIDFVEHQRSLGCQVPHVAFMSGNWTEKNLRRAHELGARVFQKPFATDEFRDWVDACSDRLPADWKLSRGYLKNVPPDPSDSRFSRPAPG